jgi:hypothetical protein
MTGAAFIALGAYMGVATMAVAEAEGADPVPWQLITNGSATAAVLVVGFFLLRRESQERAAERGAFTAALKDVSNSLGTRMEQIAAQLKESDARVAETLRDVAGEMREGRGVAVAAVQESLCEVRESLKELSGEVRARAPRSA